MFLSDKLHLARTQSIRTENASQWIQALLSVLSVLCKITSSPFSQPLTSCNLWLQFFFWGGIQKLWQTSYWYSSYSSQTSNHAYVCEFRIVQRKKSLSKRQSKRQITVSPFSRTKEVFLLGRGGVVCVKCSLCQKKEWTTSDKMRSIFHQLSSQNGIIQVIIETILSSRFNRGNKSYSLKQRRQWNYLCWWQLCSFCSFSTHDWLLFSTASIALIDLPCRMKWNIKERNDPPKSFGFQGDTWIPSLFACSRKKDPHMKLSSPPQ